MASSSHRVFAMMDSQIEEWRRRFGPPTAAEELERRTQGLRSYAAFREKEIGGGPKTAQSQNVSMFSSPVDGIDDVTSSSVATDAVDERKPKSQPIQSANVKRRDSEGPTVEQFERLESSVSFLANELIRLQQEAKNSNRTILTLSDVNTQLQKQVDELKATAIQCTTELREAHRRIESIERLMMGMHHRSNSLAAAASISSSSGSNERLVSLSVTELVSLLRDGSQQVSVSLPTQQKNQSSEGFSVDELVEKVSLVERKLEEEMERNQRWLDSVVAKSVDAVRGELLLRESVPLAKDATPQRLAGMQREIELAQEKALNEKRFAEALEADARLRSQNNTAERRRAEAAEKKLAEEAAERRRAEAADKKLAEEAAERRRAEAADKKLAEEAAERRRAEAADKKLAEEAAERRRAEVADKKLAEEAAERRRAEAAEKKLAEEAAERRRAEAAEKKLAEEAAERRRAEVADKKLAEEAAERRRAEAAVENVREAVGLPQVGGLAVKTAVHGTMTCADTSLGDVSVSSEEERKLDEEIAPSGAIFDEIDVDGGVDASELDGSSSSDAPALPDGGNVAVDVPSRAQAPRAASMIHSDDESSSEGQFKLKPMTQTNRGIATQKAASKGISNFLTRKADDFDDDDDAPKQSAVIQSAKSVAKPHNSSIVRAMPKIGGLATQNFDDDDFEF